MQKTQNTTQMLVNGILFLVGGLAMMVAGALMMSGCGSEEDVTVQQPNSIVASLLCQDYGEEEACSTAEAIAAGTRLWLELASWYMDVPATGRACDFVEGFDQGAESCDRREAMQGVHEEIEVARCVEVDRGTAAWCAIEGWQSTKETILAATVNQ